MKKILLVAIIVVLVMGLVGCLPGDLEENDDKAGFFWGVWHGWIAPLSLIVSIFKDNVTMFEYHNIGFWYEAGFYMAVISGFGGITISRSRSKKDD